MQQQITGRGGMMIGPITELVAEGKSYREILRLADEERAELICHRRACKRRRAERIRLDEQPRRAPGDVPGSHPLGLRDRRLLCVSVK